MMYINPDALRCDDLDVMPHTKGEKRTLTVQVYALMRLLEDADAKHTNLYHLVRAAQHLHSYDLKERALAAWEAVDPVERERVARCAAHYNSPEVTAKKKDDALLCQCIENLTNRTPSRSHKRNEETAHALAVYRAEYERRVRERQLKDRLRTDDPVMDYVNGLFAPREEPPTPPTKPHRPHKPGELRLRPHYLTVVPTQTGGD